MIGLLKKNFIHMDCHSHLEYASSVWSSYKKYDIQQIEKIQKRAAELAITLRKLPHKDRLISSNLHKLKHRKLQACHGYGYP